MLVLERVADHVDPLGDGEALEVLAGEAVRQAAERGVVVELEHVALDPDHAVGGVGVVDELDAVATVAEEAIAYELHGERGTGVG